MPARRDDHADDVASTQAHRAPAWMCRLPVDPVSALVAAGDPSLAWCVRHDLLGEAGDANVLGQCAKMGFPVVPEDIGPGLLIEPEKLQMKIPFVMRPAASPRSTASRACGRARSPKT